MAHYAFFYDGKYQSEVMITEKVVFFPTGEVRYRVFDPYWQYQDEGVPKLHGWMTREELKSILSDPKVELVPIQRVEDEEIVWLIKEAKGE